MPHLNLWFRNARRGIWAILGAVVVVATTMPLTAAAGELDASFGTNGLVSVDLSGTDAANAIAVDTNGRVVVAGSADDGHSLGVVRLTPRGRRDSTFDDDGVRLIPFGASAYPAGLALGRDHSVVLVAALYEPQSRTGDETADLAANIALNAPRLALVKLRSNGSLDRRFGDNGIAVVKPVAGGPVFEGPIAMAMHRDGSIVVAAAQGFGLGYFGGAVESYLYRFSPGGRLDASFGAAGVAPMAPWALTGFTPADVFIQPDGRIVVGGNLWGGFTSDFVIQRYLPNGSADPSFGTAGSSLVDLGDSPVGWDTLRGIAPGPRGKIVAFGEAPSPSRGWIPALVQLGSDGHLTTTFGSGGVLRLPGATGMVTDAAVQSDGAIVAATQILKRPRFEPELLRVRRDGSIDDSFGRPTARFDVISGIALQPDRVLATGPSDSQRPNAFLVAAFER